MPRLRVSCRVVLAGMIGVIAVSALVVLAGSLAGYSEAPGYVRPADLQCYRMVNERCHLGVEFRLAQPGPGDPLQHLCRGESSDPICRVGWCRWRPVPVARPHVFDLLPPGLAHSPQNASKD